MGPLPRAEARQAGRQRRARSWCRPSGPPASAKPDEAVGGDGDRRSTEPHGAPGLYVQYATLAYAAGQTRKGDLAGRQGGRASPRRTSATALKSQLEAAKKAATVDDLRRAARPRPRDVGLTQLDCTTRAPVAQLAEQRTLNPKVPGSIPGGGTQEARHTPGFLHCSAPSFESGLCPEYVPRRGGERAGVSAGWIGQRPRVSRARAERGPVWHAKYRLPDGRQVQKTIGPAWTERGRPAAGYFTKRTAEAWLREVLAQARAGTLPGMVRTGVTFAERLRASGCATSSRTATASRRRCATTARASARTSCRRSATCALEDVTPRGDRGVEAHGCAMSQPDARSSC